MTLFYFGKEYGRYEVTPLKGRIDSEDIKRLIEIVDDEKALDDFLDALIESKGFKYSLVLGLLVGELKEFLPSLLAGAPGGVYSEEHVFGIGNTKQKAKLAFADIDAEDDDGDW